jgi:hypothetical protein
LAIKSQSQSWNTTYSPDVTPCNFFLFPAMKSHLKESQFETMEEIQKVTMAALYNLHRNDFWKCFNTWKQGWVSCIDARRNCSEGEHCSLE